jgi:hypothetical protein
VRQTIILKSEQLEVEAKRIRFERDILDVPRVGERWNRVEAPRGTRLELEGVCSDGTPIDGVFRLIRRRDDGALEVERWSDRDKVGGGQE